MIPKKFTPIVQDIGLDYIKIKGNAQDEEATTENAKSGIAKYEYYINNEKKGEIESEEFTIKELTKGTSYNIHLIAYDKAENKKQSEEITETTLSIPLPPKTDLHIDENKSTLTLLDRPVLTLKGLMNYRVEPNLGESVTLEITDTPKENVKYYYSLDEGSNWNEYSMPVQTEYLGQNKIKVKTVYKNSIESEHVAVVKYKRDLSYECTAANCLKNVTFDEKFDTYQLIDTSGGTEFYCYVAPECWRMYVSLYCQTENDNFGVCRIDCKLTDLTVRGYLTKNTGIPAKMLATRSLYIPETAEKISIFVGTGGLTHNFKVYEIWCSEENLSGKTVEELQ